MILIDAKILKIDIKQQLALVEPIMTSQCSICNHKGCGAVSITQLFSLHRKKSFYAKLSKPSSIFQIGHKVSIEVSEAILLKSAILGYIFPLIGLILGAGIGNLFSEIISILSAFSGMLISFLLLRLNIFKLHLNQLPKIKHHIL